MYREPADQPSRLSIDYPEQSLNRLTTFFRLFAALPILIVLGTISGGVGRTLLLGVHGQDLPIPSSTRRQ
jgi:hypothetical protein